MDLIRAITQESTHADLSTAEMGRKRILHWYDTVPTALRYTGSTTKLQDLPEQYERARFVQSLVIYMIVHHANKQGMAHIETRGFIVVLQR